MKCDACSEYLMRYFDKELNDIETAQFKQHLKVCRSCREEYDTLNAILGIIEIDGVLTPPDNFESKVMSKISSFNEKRKRTIEIAITVLYNIGAIAASILLVIYVANVKHVNFGNMFKDLSNIFKYLGTVDNVKLPEWNTVFNTAITAGKSIINTITWVVSNYYYVIVSLLAALILIQKLFFMVVQHEGRKQVQ